MRLLVYGGNEHNIRCEIGSWDLSDKGALLDTYGIPKDGWVIGFGILKDEGFLFLKTTQIAGTRIYPFTILLDPGEEIWQKFGWNAAHLACSLLEKDKQLNNELVNNPESFNLQKLEGLIDSLSLYKFELQETSVTHLIAGTVFETEIIAVNPLQLNQPLLEVHEIAEQIEAMPPCFRTGNGWLFGGSEANAASLGIKLVFDINLQTIDRERIEKIIQKGNETLQPLKMQGEQLQSKFTDLTSIPSWRWDKKFSTTPAKMLSGLSNLADLKDRDSITDSELELLYENNNGLFAAEIQQRLLNLACRTTEMLSAERTNFLLKKYSEKALTAEQIPKDYLHRKTYETWLVEMESFPSESELDIKLSDYDYFEVCREIILREKDLKNIPKLFYKSIAELRKNNASDFTQNLIDVVYQKTSGNLAEIWNGYRNHDLFKKLLAAKFKEKSREMVRNTHDNWNTNYLRFAEDQGGNWLHENDLIQQNNSKSSSKANIFIEWLIRYLKQNPTSQDSTAWFQALPTSPLRNKLPNKVKAVIAGLNKDLANSWKNFTSLMDLLEGKSHTVKKLDAPDEEIYLRQELKEFLQMNPAVNLEKLREPLKTFFGKYPDEFVQVWNSAKIEPEKEEKATQTKKTNEQPKETAATPTKNEIFPFDEDAISNLKKTADEINKMIRSALNEKATEEKFVENFQFKVTCPTYCLFPNLSLQTRANILHILYRNNGKKLKKNLETLYHEGAYNFSAIAVWECLLLTKMGKKITNELKNGLLKKVNLDVELSKIVEKAAEKDTWGCNLLEPKNDLESKEQENSEEAVHQGKSWKESFKPYVRWIVFWKK